MNRKYRVICLAVSGRNNKIYRKNDVVSEGAFPDGRAEQYVKSQHMERVEESDEVATDAGSPEGQTPPDDNLNPDLPKAGEENFGPDAGEDSPEMTGPKKDETSDDEDQADDEAGSGGAKLSKTFLKKELTKRGVSYNPKASQEELMSLYLL